MPNGDHQKPRYDHIGNKKKGAGARSKEYTAKFLRELGEDDFEQMPLAVGCAMVAIFCKGYEMATGQSRVLTMRKLMHTIESAFELVDSLGDGDDKKTDNSYQGKSCM